MFMQGTSATDRAPGGLGIGLTLVRSLVELHGGRVTAHSDGPDRGSVFSVYLPIAPGGSRGEEPEGRRDRPLPQASPRILVVDDNHDAADSLGALLEILGATIAVAHDGEGALKSVETHRPDIVFLDIGMPRMDGYEVARRIRARPDGHRIYLVALTGWGQDKDRLKSEAAGFDRHMVKPADIASLESLLQSAGATASRAGHLSKVIAATKP
jgi:CheY-like chemotaxis protein